jgi:hypothetical protein
MLQIGGDQSKLDNRLAQTIEFGLLEKFHSTRYQTAEIATCNYQVRHSHQVTAALGVHTALHLIKKIVQA